MADNKKFRPPQVIVTPTMLKAGTDFMAACVSDEAENDPSDESLIIGTFLAMWTAYWEEINATHKRKQTGSPIVKVPGLILPGRPN